MNFSQNNTDFILWRYMDFTKFEDLIKTSSLFFTFRKYFFNASEGEDPKLADMNRLINYVYNMNQIDLLNNLCYGSGCSLWPNSKGFIQARKQQLNDWLDNTGISCWTTYEEISDLMFELFTNNDNSAIAIKTTKNNLLQALPQLIRDDIMAEKVIYFNYNDNICFDVKNYRNFLKYMDISRINYQVEKEFRLFYNLSESTQEDRVNNYQRGCFQVNLDIEAIGQIECVKILRANKQVKGFRIPINLEILNPQIYCTPCKSEEIEQLLYKYGYNFQIFDKE